MNTICEINLQGHEGSGVRVGVQLIQEEHRFRLDVGVRARVSLLTVQALVLRLKGSTPKKEKHRFRSGKHRFRLDVGVCARVSLLSVQV